MKSPFVPLATLSLLIMLAAIGYRTYQRSMLEQSYEFRRSLIAPNLIVEVGSEQYAAWHAATASDRRVVGHPVSDAFGLLYPALADAGFEPSIEGYLAVRTAVFPPAAELSARQLDRWNKASGLRLAVDTGGTGTIYVHRSSDGVLGLHAPTASDKLLLLYLLNGNVFREYVIPVRAADEASEQTDVQGAAERSAPVDRNIPAAAR